MLLHCLLLTSHTIKNSNSLQTIVRIYSKITGVGLQSLDTMNSRPGEVAQNIMSANKDDSSELLLED